MACGEVCAGWGSGEAGSALPVSRSPIRIVVTAITELMTGQGYT
jgi:hypothetical protein